MIDVLCLGGTGTVGREVVKALRARGAAVRCMTRDSDRAGTSVDGVEYVWGDLEKPGSLPPLFADVPRIHVLTPLHPDEAGLGLAAIHAAREAGAERIVLHGVHQADRAPEIPHFASKLAMLQAAVESGIPWVTIEPNSYFQNDYRLRRPLLEHGVYPSPLGPVGVSRVDVRDIADATANALLDDGHVGNRYPVVGPFALTGQDVARIWGEHLGREIDYTGDDLDAWEASVRATLPDWMVADLRAMSEHVLEHGLVATEEDIASMSHVLGHAPRTFDDFAGETAAAWAASREAAEGPGGGAPGLPSRGRAAAGDARREISGRTTPRGPSGRSART